MTEIEVDPLWGIREPVSCLTHLLAIPLFILLGYYLIRRGRGDMARVASLTMMVLATIFTLAASAAYHFFDYGPDRLLMSQLDLAGIFSLIAATVAPVHAILFTGFHRWVPIVLIWLAAVVGMALRLLFPASLTPVGDFIFLLMGWGGAISCWVLWRRYGYAFVRPLLWGGIAYTLGVIVLTIHWPILLPGVFATHEFWHVTVLVGLALHWKFVFQFAAGPPQGARETAELAEPISV